MKEMLELGQLDEASFFRRASQSHCRGKSQEEEGRGATSRFIRGGKVHEQTAGGRGTIPPGAGRSRQKQVLAEGEAQTTAGRGKAAKHGARGGAHRRNAPAAGRS